MTLRDSSDEAHYATVERDIERLTMRLDNDVIIVGPNTPASAVEELERRRTGRTFDTGATRDTDEGKFDYEAFNAPIVERTYASYMHDNRTQVDGQVRDGDNWQKGMPRSAYMKSLIRHTFDLWYLWRNAPSDTSAIITLLCAVRFNVNGLMYEILRGRNIDA